MRLEVFKKDNDNLVELSGLKKASDGTVVNDATVTIEDVVDKDGSSISGVSFPVTMSATGSDGKYQGTLGKDLSVSEGQFIRVKVKADTGSIIANWETPTIVQIREE